MRCINFMFALLIALCVQPSFSETTYTIKDTTSEENIVFVEVHGESGQAEPGGLIVFEGMLTGKVSVAKSAANNGHDLAAIQMLLHIDLSDTLPNVDDASSMQGSFVAVAVDPDDDESALGTVYGLGTTEGIDGTDWVMAKIEDDQPMVMDFSDPKYVTIGIDYTDGSYEIRIGDGATGALVSQPISSQGLETEKDGIESVALMGSGGIESIATYSGSLGPLSSMIDFQVYSDAKGVLFIIKTVSEQSEGQITVEAKTDEGWQEVGSIAADGSGEYRFYAVGGFLEVGQAYFFRVRDEIGNEHAWPFKIEVKTTLIEAITLMPDVLVVSFDSEPEARYRIISAENLTDAEWIPTAVYVGDDEGSVYGSEPFIAVGNKTTVRIPRNKQRAFFKVLKVD